ncbi:signal peptidase I [Cunninghamella echinulata]|nr:signal peptidase I [Cunninghamella echinulata]
MFGQLKRMNIRQTALQVLNFLTKLAAAYMIWKSLSLALNNERPIMVVLGASMDPAINRGDLLVLTLLQNEPIEINDVCVFKLSGRETPIVHRVVKLHGDIKAGKQYLLTKGDSNLSDDRLLYNDDQMWISEEHIIGKVKGFVPYVGMVTIIMNDYPSIKYVVLGIFGLFAILQRK